MSSDINVQTFSGKVNITSNLLVGSSHLFVDTINNRVGLVTNTPSAGLHVNSNAYVHTDFRVGSGIVMNDTTGRITAGAFHGDGTNITGINSDSGSWVNGTDVVYLSTIGDKVGIGTTSPGSALDVVGDVQISGETVLGTATYRKKRVWNRNALAYVYLGNIQTLSTTGIRLDVNIVNANSGYQSYSFQINLQGDDTSHAGGRLMFTAVGLNNASTLRNVEIGYVYAAPSSGIYEYQLWLKDPTTNVSGPMSAYLNCQGFYNFNTGISDIAQGSGAPTNFQLGVPTVVCDTSGNVGIGTTTPAKKLHVEHFGSAIGDFEGIRIANHATNLHSTSRPAYEFVVSDIAAGTGIGASKFAIGYRGTTSASRTDRLVIDASGNVGIGTNNPTNSLHVYKAAGEATSGLLIEKASGTAGTAAALLFGTSAPSETTNKNIAKAGIFFERTATNGRGNFQFCLDNVDNTTPIALSNSKMTITSSGNVGIGTTDPDYTLDVNGTLGQNGKEIYAQRRWEIDLTAQSNAIFYPIEFKHQTPAGVSAASGSPQYPPVHFKVFGDSLSAADPYNENTLVGYAKGGGYSDHGPMYDVHVERHHATEHRFQGLYEGNSSYSHGFVIYMRGGYRYSTLTDASEVVTHTTTFDMTTTEFALKNVSGADVSGTSLNITQLVNIAGASGEQRWMSGSLNIPGNVGIGTTSPTGKLHVSTSSGDSNSTDCLIIGGSTNCSGNTNLRIGCHNDYAWVQSHCGEPLCLNPAGNLVGIGTTNPTAMLHVNAGTGVATRIMGSAQWPNRPFAMMGRNGGRIYAPNVFVCNVTGYNSGIANTSNGRFTAPTGFSGYYLCTYSGLAGLGETGPNDRWYKNGVELQFGSAHVNSAGNTPSRWGMSAQSIVYLSQGDYVEHRVITGSLYGSSPIHSTHIVMYLHS